MERIKKRWENEELTAIGRREAHAQPTDFGKTTVESLAGLWDFRYLEAPEYSPEGFSDEGYDSSSWDKIKVPLAWQMSGYGMLQYTDVWYHFPINPPYVPSMNPTGLYRTTFNVSSVERKTIIRFEGVSSAYDFWVNGNHAGYAKVSHLASEFDISSLVKEGKNQLAVRVYQFCDGSYLERQDMWNFSGIFRDVRILSEPKESITDCVIKAGCEGGLSLNVLSSIPEALLSYQVSDGNGKVVAEGTGPVHDGIGSLQNTIDDVHPWTAETPCLYHLSVKLLKDGKTADEKGYQFGFRTIEVKDGVFTVNGQAILLNGVNMHDFSPTGGSTVDPDVIEDDIRMMKRYNINAIRCSHYPKMDYFYSLCDTYGLYVIDEADIEAHGFEWVGMYTWPSEQKSWMTSYVDRNERMVREHINHPCIIFWSLGNETGFGPNFIAATERIRELDDTRLIHYEGDDNGDYTDIHSNMYTRLKRLEEIAKGSEYHNEPQILCEYGHSMGTGPGNLQEYQDLFLKYRKLQGGFIWEWYDHGIRHVGKDGKVIYRYGGDYGDEPNNGNFCIDGLLMPERRACTGLACLKAVIAPVKCRPVDLGKGVVEIRNTYDFLTLENIEADWSVVKDDVVIQSGTMSLPSVPAHEVAFVTIPYTSIEPEANTDYRLLVVFKDIEAHRYAKSGREITRVEFVLPLHKRELLPLKVTACRYTSHEGATRLTVQGDGVVVLFDKVTGRLLSYVKHGKSYLTSGPKMNVKRATIDNDMYKAPDWTEKYFIQKPDEQLESFSHREDEYGAVITVCTCSSFWSQVFGFHCTYIWHLDGDGDLSLSLNGKAYMQSPFHPDMLERVGVEMELADGFDDVMWYGLGPEENYRDMKAHALLGVYGKSVEAMHEDYVRPQENGHREETRWLSLSRKDDALLFQFPTPVGFDAHDYTIAALEKAKHRGEIEKCGHTILHVDAFHSGLGTNSCGEEQLYENKAKLNDFTLRLEMRVVKTGSVIPESKKLKECFDEK